MADVAGQTGQEDRQRKQHIPRGPELRRSLRFLTAAWLFGAVWLTATSGAPLTLFAHALGASNLQFGLLSAIPFAAWLVSLPASWLIDRTGRRKLIFMLGLYLQRLMWIPIALLPQALRHIHGGGPGSPATIGFLLLILIMYCGNSIGSPAWVSWMADLVPDRKRGKYFGRRRGWGMVTTIPAAIIVGLILDRLLGDDTADPARILGICGYIFMAAAVFGTMDVALHHPIPAIPAKPVNDPDPLAGFTKPLTDHNFLWFVGFAGTMNFAVSFMAQFVTLYVIDKLKVTNTGTQMMLIAIPALAQLLVLSGWGHAVDRYGKKPVMAIASLGLVPVGFGWCFMNSGAVWLGYLLTALGAALFCGVEVANLNIMLEMSGTDESAGGGGSSYAAVNSIIYNICGCLGGIIAGIIAQLLKDWTWDIGLFGLAPISFYEVLFALSGVMRLVAVVVFLPRVHEPAAKPAREALRFMTSNIYNNLFNVVTMPWRATMGRRHQDQ